MTGGSLVSLVPAEDAGIVGPKVSADPRPLARGPAVGAHTQDHDMPTKTVMETASQIPTVPMAGGSLVSLPPAEDAGTVGPEVSADPRPLARGLAVGAHTQDHDMPTKTVMETASQIPTVPMAGGSLVSLPPAED